MSRRSTPSTRSTTLETEARVGGLDLEPQRAEVSSVRESEELIAWQGRTSFHTVALDRGGVVAGYTHLVVSGADGNAYQWGTLVRREDRGHRLGLALKVANPCLLQRERPEVRSVTTYNAESNVHMVGVKRRARLRAGRAVGGAPEAARAMTRLV